VRRLKLESDSSRVSKASTDFERTSNPPTVSPTAAIGSSSPNSLRFVKGARLAVVPEEVATIVMSSGGEALVKLKVQKIGNLLGVVLPKEVVSRLKADEGDRLFLIEGPEGTYHLTAYDPGFEKKIEKAEDIVRRHRNTLRVLAK
jgi:putative addiction module antidote